MRKVFIFTLGQHLSVPLRKILFWKNMRNFFQVKFHSFQARGWKERQIAHMSTTNCSVKDVLLDSID